MAAVGAEAVLGDAELPVFTCEPDICPYSELFSGWVLFGNCALAPKKRYRRGRFSWARSVLLVAGSAVGVLQGTTLPYAGEVLSVENLTHAVKRISLRIQPRSGFSFTPGQFVLLKVPDYYVAQWNARYSTNHTSVIRPYSIASAPQHLPHLDLVIGHQPSPESRVVPPGLASTYVHVALQPGDILSFSTPKGSLYLQNTTKVTFESPLIMVAGGTGIAPFISILEYCFTVRTTRELHLYLGVRSMRDLLLHKLLSHWADTHNNFHYVPALSRPTSEDIWHGETGYINTVLNRHFDTSLSADVAIAGSPVMIRETIRVLRAKGLDRHRIRHDAMQER